MTSAAIRAIPAPDHDLGPATKATPIEGFVAHARARARLFADGKLELLDAVDGLQTAAVARGLVDAIGQDQVQVILAAAFAAVRAEGSSATAIAARIRPLLADNSRPTKERIRILWAAAKAARGAANVRATFMALAIETNLIDRRGRWTRDDVREDVRRHGAVDIEHVIACAQRGCNPFEKGELK